MGESRAWGAHWDFLCIRGISTQEFARSSPRSEVLLKVLKLGIKPPVVLQE